MIVGLNRVLPFGFFMTDGALMQTNAASNVCRLIEPLCLNRASRALGLLLSLALMGQLGCDSQQPTQAKASPKTARMGNLYSLSQTEESTRLQQDFSDSDREAGSKKTSASGYASATWKISSDGSGNLLFREQPHEWADTESDAFFDRLYERNGSHASWGEDRWEKREDGVRLGYREDRRDKDFVGDDWIHEGR